MGRQHWIGGLGEAAPRHVEISGILEKDMRSGVYGGGVEVAAERRRIIWPAYLGPDEDEVHTDYDTLRDNLRLRV
jgi:hypothetical protein